MKVGIIGGSFDPIHFGHLIMAEHLRIEKKLDKIIFIPTGYAPHKKYLNSGEIRIEMVNIAIENNEHFLVCDIEIKKNKINYTIDTLRELKLKYPDCDFYFIIGLDNLYNLETWNEVENLGEMAKFLVSHRIFNEKLSNENIKDKCLELSKKYKLNIEIVDTPIIEISSSNIRERIKKELSINYLAPRRVIEYIENNGLYK